MTEEYGADEMFDEISQRAREGKLSTEDVLQVVAAVKTDDSVENLCSEILL